MHHSYNSVKKLPPCTGEFEDSADTPELAKKALHILKSMYQVLWCHFESVIFKYVRLIVFCPRRH